MILFAPIPVCASTLARHLNRCMVPTTFDGCVTFMRDPLERFWSAVKKDTEKGYFADRISLALTKLGTGHLTRAVDEVKGADILEVVVMDDHFNASVQRVVEKYKVSWIENFSLAHALKALKNASSEENAPALAYIQNNADVLDKVKSYYAEDFAWWESILNRQSEKEKDHD